MVILHGVTGGFDELIIAVVAIGVLWLAVKLAGRKPADEDEEHEQAAAEREVEQHPETARPPATPLGQ